MTSLQFVLRSVDVPCLGAESWVLTCFRKGTNRSRGLKCGRDAAKIPVVSSITVHIAIFADAGRKFSLLNRARR